VHKAPLKQDNFLFNQGDGPANSLMFPELTIVAPEMLPLLFRFTVPAFMTVPPAVAEPLNKVSVPVWLMFGKTHSFSPLRNGMVPNTAHILLHLATAATVIVRLVK
jgi:hypothetical protein